MSGIALRNPIFTRVKQLSSEVPECEYDQNLSSLEKTFVYALSPEVSKKINSHTRHGSNEKEMTDIITLGTSIFDKGTAEHMVRVGVLASEIAIKYGLSEKTAGNLEYAATLHDVGKLITPKPILNSEERINSESSGPLRDHPANGYLLLEFHPDLKYAANIALTHHERWDGKGYPRKLKGELIPLPGRIVSAADVFDALLTDRSYRKARTIKETQAIMNYDQKGKFDPEILDILFDNLDHMVGVQRYSRKYAIDKLESLKTMYLG